MSLCPEPVSSMTVVLNGSLPPARRLEEFLSWVWNKHRTEMSITGAVPRTKLTLVPLLRPLPPRASLERTLLVAFVRTASTLPLPGLASMSARPSIVPPVPRSIVEQPHSGFSPLPLDSLHSHVVGVVSGCLQLQKETKSPTGTVDDRSS